MRRLTTRRLRVLIKGLPADSVTSQAINGTDWTSLHYLVSDVFHAQAGQPHPGRPKPSSVRIDSPEREERKRAARRRAAARQQAIEAGEIT